MINPKISICIPVYNVEKYLKNCLDSAISQTYKNIEIICVEDCSTDNSPQILDEYVKKDSRIKVIKHNQNKGMLIGRKTAVNIATGDYIMFLDSDDSITKDACKVIAKQIKRKAFDIIAFNCNIIDWGVNGEKPSKDFVKHFKSQLKNKEILTGKKIFEECFSKEKFTFNVWNKAYKAELCKKVHSLLPDRRVVWAEDLFASQYLMYHAKDMIYLEKNLYNYSFGTGISTGIIDWNKNISNYFNDLEFIEIFQDYLRKNNDEKSSIYAACELKKKKTINYIIRLILGNVSNDIAVSTLNKLLNMYGIDLISNMIDVCGMDCQKLAKIAYQIKIEKPKAQKVKNIGLFYYRIGNGGVERVIQTLSPLLCDAGYNVTLFITKKSKGDYQVDKRVNIEIIPSIDCEINFDYVRKRYAHWERIIKKHKIDTIMYQASSSPYIFYEILFFKLMGVYFVTTAHELFSQEMCNNIFTMQQRMISMQGVDFIQTLSRVEEAFWQKLGVNAKYIPNPLTFNPQDNMVAPKKDKTIIWVGRLVHYQKKPKDAIDIMSIIHKQDKDVRMIMLGKAETESETQEIYNYIKGKGLEGIVKNIYDNDVKKYYEKSSLLLSTSTYESFSLVLAEAMSFGLPCVIYNMPYLELAQANKGVISIEQRNINAAAQQILALLNDREVLNEKGLYSKEFMNNFAKRDPMKDWEEVFKSLPNLKSNKNENMFDRIMLETIFEHYTVGVRERMWVGNSRQLSKLERLARSLAVNGVFKTFKKVLVKAKRKITGR